MKLYFLFSIVGINNTEKKYVFIKLLSGWLTMVDSIRIELQISNVYDTIVESKIDIYDRWKVNGISRLICHRKKLYKKIARIHLSKMGRFRDFRGFSWHPHNIFLTFVTFLTLKKHNTFLKSSTTEKFGSMESFLGKWIVMKLILSRSNWRSKVIRLLKNRKFDLFDPRFDLEKIDCFFQAFQSQK